jgi:hypothetical protein
MSAAFHVGNDERAAAEFLTGAFERFLGRLERRVLELVAQRRKCDVGVWFTR